MLSAVLYETRSAHTRMQVVPTAHGTESMFTNKIMVSSVQDVLR